MNSTMMFFARAGKCDSLGTSGFCDKAWRMVIELVTGMGVGFGIGYGLDYAFGTLPIFLVIFCLMGFAAGVRVMIQTAQELAAEEQRKGEEAQARQSAKE